MYFVRSVLNDSPEFDLALDLGGNPLTAKLKLDGTKGIIAKLSETNIYVYDKVYIANKVGKYSLDIQTLLDLIDKHTDDPDTTKLLKELLSGEGVSGLDALTVSRIDDSLEIKLTSGEIKVALKFSYKTNYLEEITVNYNKINVTVTPTEKSELKTADTLDGFTAIDYVTELVEPALKIAGEKQFTIAIENLKFTSQGQEITASGSISLDLSNESPLIGIDVKFTKPNAKTGKTYTHTLKATYKESTEANGNDITAVYNGNLKVNLTKETLFAIIFKVTDILNIKLDALEKYRPEIAKPEAQSEIIFNALPEALRNEINSFVDTAEKGDMLSTLDLTGYLTYLDYLAVGGESGNIELTIANDKNIKLTIGYGDTIDSIGFDVNGASGTIKLTYTYKEVTINDAQFTYDINGLNDLLNYTLNTVNLGEYKVTGTINLTLISFIPYNIPFTLVAKIVDNTTPFVYVKLEVPYILGLVNKSDSYIFFYDGMMYLKREFYSHVPIIGDRYSKTEYRKRTPAEFANNLVDNLFFLIPMSDTIRGEIDKQIAKSDAGDLDFSKAITKFTPNGKEFDITLDLNELTGKTTLGDVNVHLIHGEKDGETLLDSFTVDMSLLIGIVKINLDAKLDTYNGEIEYGVKSEKDKGKIEDMAEKIPSFNKWN